MWLRMHFSIHCAVLELTLRLIVVERLIGQSQLGLTTSQLECHTELHLPSRVKITKHFSTAQWMRKVFFKWKDAMSRRACILFTRPIFDNDSYDRGENVQKLPLVAIRKEKCTLAIGQWCAAAIVRSDGRSTIVVVDHPPSIPPFSMA